MKTRTEKRPRPPCGMIVLLVMFLLSILTALHADPVEALRKGDMESVNHYLREGGYPDAADVNGRTLLMWAAFGSNLPMMQILLEAGADPEIENEMGETALIMAVVGGSEESVCFLLSSGADGAYRNRDGLSAASYARMFGKDNLLPVLTVP
jgi:uncharacterized protein